MIPCTTHSIGLLLPARTRLKETKKPRSYTLPTSYPVTKNTNFQPLVVAFRRTDAVQQQEEFTFGPTAAISAAAKAEAAAAASRKDLGCSLLRRRPRGLEAS